MEDNLDAANLIVLHRKKTSYTIVDVPHKHNTQNGFDFGIFHDLTNLSKVHL